MKKFFFNLLVVALVPFTGIAQKSIPDGLAGKQSCTIMYASDGEQALGGNNEDWNNPFTKIWFLPAKAGKYGRVYFGFDSFMPQGGMNDQGLFFDAAVAETINVPYDSGKLDFEGSLMLKVMAECGSVDEALKLFEEYNVSGNWNGQYLIGDKYGHSAIIEPQTILKKTDRYQIATNFYQSKKDPEEYTCDRYRIANEIFEKSEEISVDLFRRILDAVHYESESRAETLYSNIYDLKNGQIYLYHFHNFHNVFVLDLKEELRKGVHFYNLPSLFPKTFAAERYMKDKSEKFNELLKEKGIIVDINPQIYETYAGRYEVPPEMELPEGSTIELKKIDNQLTLIINKVFNLKVYKLNPTSETEFFNLYSGGGSYFTISFISQDKNENPGFIFDSEDGKFTIHRISL